MAIPTRKERTLPEREADEEPKHKEVCRRCRSDAFRVYITVIIDDARLYCARCGERAL